MVFPDHTHLLFLFNFRFRYTTENHFLNEHNDKYFQQVTTNECSLASLRRFEILNLLSYVN